MAATATTAPTAPSDRTTVRRLPARADYERSTIEAVLDEGFVCHVGFVADGQPYVIPTAYARAGGTLYLHGSPANRMLRTVRRDGVDVCVTVTLVDGLVFARSAFHHSINYRSVVVFGHAVEVTDLAEKARIFRAFVDHVVPGRAAEVREPSEKELRSTLLLALPITEASAKVRSGPPLDDEDDYALPVWAGELPLRVVAQRPVADARVRDGIEPSPVVTAYARPNRS